MNKCVIGCLYIFILFIFFSLSGCNIDNKAFIRSSLQDMSVSTGNPLLFFNNPCFIATEYSVLSNKKSEVISGDYSLKGECKSNSVYAVFLFTDKTMLPLHPGNTYTVSFDYRILTKKTKGFEVLFYSPSAAENNDLPEALRITAKKGAEGRACFTRTLKDYDDYMIYWSIAEGGSISIDNINIIEENSHRVCSVFNIEAEHVVLDVNRESLAQKIANKATIPNFCPWMSSEQYKLYDASDNPYSLIWTRRGLHHDIESPFAMLSGLESYRMQKDMTTLYLITPDWNMWTPARSRLSGRSEFYLNESFKLHKSSE